MTSAAAELRSDDVPFAPLDWGLLLSAASIWGASFLFMAIGLDAFEPGVVTFLRIGFGAATLARLYTMHALLLPGLTFGVLFVHLWMLSRRRGSVQS